MPWRFRKGSFPPTFGHSPSWHLSPKAAIASAYLFEACDKIDRDQGQRLRLGAWGGMTQPLNFLAPLALLALTACQTANPDGPPLIGKATASSADTRAPAFIEAACGGCHAVEPPFLSPNPASPSFAAIANRRGLSEKSLGDWLEGAHNYPEQMDFTLTRPQIDQIAGYMVTLRHAGYVPDQ